MKNIKIILIVFIAGALSMTLEAKKLNLKYILEKGQEITFIINTNQKIGQEVMGQIQDITSDVSQTVKFKVTDITGEGNYLIEKTIVKFKVTSGSPMGDMEFDSESSDVNESFQESLGMFVDVPIRFVMDPSGKVVEVIDVDALSKKYTDLIAGGGTEMQLIAALGAQFTSDDAIRQSVEVMFRQYPTEKIKTGKAWESTSSTHVMINLINTVSTMVNEVKGDVAILSQTVKIGVGEGTNTMEMEGMQMEYDLAGDRNGSYEVDINTGLMLKGQSVTTISGVISVDSPQLPAPMSIPMTITTTEKIERL